ncbi:MAG TPA: hypothetical protein P5534_14905 [Candidatus Paceibacterota bacterium]|nr:hypothetical protein [Candidatus Paceibacterota bacterium]
MGIAAGSFTTKPADPISTASWRWRATVPDRLTRKSGRSAEVQGFRARVRIRAAADAVADADCASWSE